MSAERVQKVQTPIVEIADLGFDNYTVRITRYSTLADVDRPERVRVVDSTTTLVGNFSDRAAAEAAQAAIWGAVCDGYHTGVAS